MNNRAPSSKRYQPTEYEHAANCATHGVSRTIYFSSHTELRAGQNKMLEKPHRSAS